MLAKVDLDRPRSLEISPTPTLQLRLQERASENDRKETK
jgi:hypothetical protein